MYVSIDIGGTSTRLAATPNFDILHKEFNFSEQKFPTFQDFVTEKNTLLEVMYELTNGKLDGICLGVPGIVNAQERKLEKIVNVPNLSEKTYQDFFGDLLPKEKILIENDAALAGLGEAVLGDSNKHNVVAYVTLSTGVGGVRIAHKKIDPTQRFSEPGHMVIQKDGRDIKLCGFPGCFTAYASGTAFEQINNIAPKDCNDPVLWENYAQYLALGLNNVLVMWAPDVIVLGGSMSQKFSLFEKPLISFLEQQHYYKVPPILKSSLGDNSGILGGFAHMSQHFK